jgi:hypothetical protein
MNERLHQILDGEAPPAAVNASEADELAAAEAMISSVLRSIATRPLPDLGPGVLQRIDALAPAPAKRRDATAWERMRDWLWSPRPLSISWRPAYACAFALAVLLAGGAALMRSPQAVPAREVFVQFRLDAPQASRVALAGNFTDWQPTVQLTRSGGGVWTVVVPLVEGVHKYSFVIDGKVWQTDPLAPAVSDGFGGENSQIAILSPDAVTES